MSKIKKLIERILHGTSDKNINFEELRKLMLSMGFNERIKGSHHIFSKDAIQEIINIQPTKDNKAKPYQVKQIRELIVNNRLINTINENE